MRTCKVSIGWHCINEQGFVVQFIQRISANTDQFMKDKTYSFTDPRMMVEMYAWINNNDLPDFQR